MCLVINSSNKSASVNWMWHPVRCWSADCSWWVQTGIMPSHDCIQPAMKPAQHHWLLMPTLHLNLFCFTEAEVVILWRRIADYQHLLYTCGTQGPWAKFTPLCHLIWPILSWTSNLNFSEKNVLFTSYMKTCINWCFF